MNYLVPTIDDPPVDYVSYSAHEVMLGQPGDWRLQNLTAAMDYVSQRLPPKPGVPGPRVFLGEVRNTARVFSLSGGVGVVSALATADSFRTCPLAW